MSAPPVAPAEIEAARPLPASLALPSWLLSGVLHGLLLLIALTSMKGCQQQSDAGTGEEGYREVGIYVKQPGRDPSAVEPVPDALETSAATAASVDSLSSPQASTTPAPPVELSLPKPDSVSVLGPGAALPNVPAGDPSELIKSTGTGGPSGPVGMSQGETSFFGVKDSGTRFVYVLDCSGSMSKYNAIGHAKNELIASLETLDSTQQFQIIFYNSEPSVMALKGEQSPQLYFATDINRTLARKFIGGIAADFGTQHLPAIKLALRMNPEVIFLLTDAKDSQVTAADMNDLRRLNQGRTRIHCIEFGEGPELEFGTQRGNFLKQLAQQTDGTYRYREMSRLGGR